MLKDERAVSPVTTEIMMIVVVVIIAAILGASVYERVLSMSETPAANILIEGATVGSSSITLVHMGGDPIPNAFTPYYKYVLNDSVFNALEVKINGVIYDGWASQNSKEISKPNFEGGDEIVLKLTSPLSVGDRISIIYVPNSQVVGWTKVL